MEAILLTLSIAAGLTVLAAAALGLLILYAGISTTANDLEYMSDDEGW